MGQRVQVIVAGGSTDPVLARATRSIPIVALSALEPVKLGHAASLSRPGGNVAGVPCGGPTMIVKHHRNVDAALVVH